MRRLTEIRSALCAAVFACVALGPPTYAQTSWSADGPSRKENENRKRCEGAARVVKAEARIPMGARDGGHENDHRARTKNRAKDAFQYTAARLLSCGAYGGAVGGAIIRAQRNEPDMMRLEQLVGVFTNFRDTAVYQAFVDVARDRKASEAARIYAWLGLYRLRTGHFWIGVQELHRTSFEGVSNPMARCGQGVTYSHTRPLWYEGAPLPPTYRNDIRNLAHQIWIDPSQPAQVRAAASCSD